MKAQDLKIAGQIVARVRKVTELLYLYRNSEELVLELFPATQDQKETRAKIIAKYEEELTQLKQQATSIGLEL